MCMVNMLAILREIFDLIDDKRLIGGSLLIYYGGHFVTVIHYIGVKELLNN